MKITVALLIAMGIVGGCSRKDAPPTSTTRTTSATAEIAPSDDQVAAEITRRLGARPDLSMGAKDVKVHVDRGIVTLRGEVRSAVAKDAIHVIANTAPGVVGLSDELTVSRSSNAGDADRTIEESARRALEADGTLQGIANRLDVLASNGIVTLRGAVSSDEERRKIETIVASTPGVAAVTNDLTIASQR